MEKTVPNYWKTELSDIDETINTLHEGKAECVGISAGGRKIWLVSYGKKNKFNRTANLSSALGAGDRACYADKSVQSYKPTIFLTGCVHGGEFEGTAALLNLISIMETGCDKAGTEFKNLRALCEKVNLLIIPCANPDGRSRIPFKSMVGRSFEELRYYNQGTWKDGSLAGWPECKKIHPIKEAAGFLGAYFNDDGVNMMHDDFFGKKAPETQILFDVVNEYVPDLTVLLHGGTNAKNHIITTAYAPDRVKKQISVLTDNLRKRFEAENIPMLTPPDNTEENEVPTSFNLPSALYQLSGEACITYESNQGLDDETAPALSYEQIYISHMILFEEAVKKLLTDFKEGGF